MLATLIHAACLLGADAGHRPTAPRRDRAHDGTRRKQGCAGVLMLPPFYYKGVTDEGLYRYFSEVIERVGDERLRLYLYHIPPVAQVGISLKLIGMLLAKYPCIVAGAKDSSGDWNNTKAMLDEFGKSASTFPGSEAHAGWPRHGRGLHTRRETSTRARSTRLPHWRTAERTSCRPASRDTRSAEVPDTGLKSGHRHSATIPSGARAPAARGARRAEAALIPEQGFGVGMPGSPASVTRSRHRRAADRARHAKAFAAGGSLRDGKQCAGSAATRGLRLRDSGHAKLVASLASSTPGHNRRLYCEPYAPSRRTAARSPSNLRAPWLIEAVAPT